MSVQESTMLSRYRVKSLLAGFILLAVLYYVFLHTASAPFRRALPLRPSAPLPSELDNQTQQRRLIRFTQARNCGLNNQLQEMLLLYYLASRLDRDFVVMDYYETSWWRVLSPPESLDVTWLHPLLKRTALPQTSAPPHTASAVNMVRPHRFAERCRDTSQRVDIDMGACATDRLTCIVSQLAAFSETACLQVDTWLLDWTFFTSKQLHSPFQDYLNVAVSRFTWDALLQKQVTERMQHLGLDKAPYIAVHIRRGDFLSHCHDLAASRFAMNAWNTLPTLTRAQSSGFAENERLEPKAILARCLPHTAWLVAKIKQEQAFLKASAHLTVTKVYIVSNAEAIEMAALQRGLADSFDAIIDGRALPLALDGTKKEQSTAGLVVDMAIATKATSFIGNGYSSLTSNIVQFRLADALRQDKMKEAEQRIALW